MVLLMTAGYFVQLLSSQSTLGNDRDIDVDLEGNLIDEGPTSAASSTHSSNFTYPILGFTSALPLPAPRPVATMTASALAPTPTNPSPESPQSDGISSASERPSIAGIGPDPAAQTSRPQPKQNSSAATFHKASRKLLEVNGCFAVVVAVLRGYNKF